MKTLQLYLSDLKELLQARDFVSARTCLKEVSPFDLADGWDYFAPEERRVIFRLLTRQKAYQTFEELESPYQRELLESLQKEYVSELLQGMDPSAVGRVARGLPQAMVRHLMSVMKHSGQEMVQKYLQYPPKTVGALMRGRFLTLEPQWTSRQALDRVQHSTRLRHIEETHLDALMVLDSTGKLLGTVGLKQLVVAPSNMPVRELMDPSVRILRPEMDQEEALRLFKRYKLKYAPVATPSGQLLGIVVYSDIFDVASEETEEDFAKMAGVGVQAADLSPWAQAKLRLPWLVITCVGGLGVSSIVKGFESTLAQIIALASFSPLIAGMGGNVGAQTATIVVRGLATGELKPGDHVAVVTREVSVGVMLGAFYGRAIAAAAFAFYGTRYGWRFSIVVGAAMFVSMTFSAFLASVEPFVFHRLGVDPATATAPLITTLTDLVSNLTYFGMATYLLLG
ncbi:MAG: magnesium transporter [Elusimicrobia bacterium]|nr:magnesium transporter [Elusimicrobiota bacterium]